MSKEKYELERWIGPGIFTQEFFGRKEETFHLFFLDATTFLLCQILEKMEKGQLFSRQSGFVRWGVKGSEMANDWLGSGHQLRGPNTLRGAEKEAAVTAL